MALWWHGALPRAALPMAIIDPAAPRLGWWLDQRSRRTVLLDVGPDHRQQALEHRIDRADHILLTHSHVDHVWGLDEVRRYNALMGSPIPVIGDARTIEELHRIYAHIFDRARNANDSWVAEQGLADRKLHGDLRDLIARTEGDAVTVGPEDTLLTAYNRMRQADVSQLPVMDEGRLIGLVDESDLLDAVERRDVEGRFKKPVSTAMTAKLTTLQATEPLDALLPIFEKDQVAIVMEGREFLGLITRIDLINYLRRAA